MTEVIAIIALVGWFNSWYWWVQYRREQQKHAQLIQEIKDRNDIADAALKLSTASGMPYKEAVEGILRVQNAHIGDTKLKKLRIRR